jgi:hypothetical protein
MFSDESTFHVSGEVQDLGQGKSTCLPATCVRQPKGERVLRPQQSQCVWTLLLHGNNHYRYFVSVHAPTVPLSTVCRITITLNLNYPM